MHIINKEHERHAPQCLLTTQNAPQYPCVVRMLLLRLKMHLITFCIRYIYYINIIIINVKYNTEQVSIKWTLYLFMHRYLTQYDNCGRHAYCLHDITAVIITTSVLYPYSYFCLLICPPHVLLLYVRQIIIIMAVSLLLINLTYTASHTVQCYQIFTLQYTRLALSAALRTYWAGCTPWRARCLCVGNYDIHFLYRLGDVSFSIKKAPSMKWYSL